MNSVYPLILLATIFSNVAGNNDVETINVTCVYNRRDGDSNICAIRNVDYGLAQPSNLIILNTDGTNDITSVEIAGRCTAMPLNIFQLFPKLKKLEMRTGLEVISKENFIGGNELNVLRLQGNRITTIEPHTFDGMDKLEMIDLFYNRLTKLEFNAFAGAINLKELNFSANRIDTIEDGAFNIPTLQSIDLSFNFLRTLSDGVFVGCSELKKLDLFDNKLTRIGKSFDNLPELRRLTLYSNTKIMDLDFYAIARNPHLGYFYSSRVELNLDDPPTALNESYAAYHLVISDNHLSYPDVLNRLRNFRNLTTLNLGYNNFPTINEIENILEMFPKLERLAFVSIPCEGEVIQRLRTKFGDNIQLPYGESNGYVIFK